MKDIKSLVRKNILELKSYTSARESVTTGILLDANENPYEQSENSFEKLNRYPDPNQMRIRKLMAAEFDVKSGNILFGNGSDEILDLIVRAFCNPGNDNVLINEPTYGMYEVLSNINNVEIRKGSLDKNFQLDIAKIVAEADSNTKIVFICSPNNPTGNLIKRQDILRLAEKLDCLILVDEAYIEFCEKASLVKEIENFPNLIVTRTFSKARGLAGIRCGYCVASGEVINILQKIKPPYNVNSCTMKIVEENLLLSQQDRNVKLIIKERNRIIEFLNKQKSILKVFPTDANFILLKIENSKRLFDYLFENQIIIRDRSNQKGLEDCLRISIGTYEENDLLMNTILEYEKKYYPESTENEELIISDKNKSNSTLDQRKGEVSRITKETVIKISLNLDGKGENDISTGIGFFDHMLEQISRHGNIDLFINAQGDLLVDEHHTVEDTGIVLGQTILKALGKKTGISRYGFFLSMDETIAKCSIDLGGRTYLNYKCKFKRDYIGSFPVELFEEFFRGLASGMKANIFLRAKGKNDHHKAEAMFKAFAKSLNSALQFDPRNRGNLPTTKGVL
ncbi:MAG: histidinol-phosphate transaminase [Rhodothermaceae bacterium]